VEILYNNLYHWLRKYWKPKLKSFPKKNKSTLLLWYSLPISCIPIASAWKRRKATGRTSYQF